MCYYKITIHQKYWRILISFHLRGNYFAPAIGTLDENKEYIESLPLNDPTEVFGLH